MPSTVASGSVQKLNQDYTYTMGDDQVVEIPLPTPDVFSFPYPTPYQIQVDLMRTVFEAIEQKKIAIVRPHLLMSLNCR